MTKKVDLKAMRQAAEQEADKALAERPFTIRSNAAAVRVFFPAIVKLRAANGEAVRDRHPPGADEARSRR